MIRKITENLKWISSGFGAQTLITPGHVHLLVEPEKGKKIKNDRFHRTLMHVSEFTANPLLLAIRKKGLPFLNAGPYMIFLKEVLDKRAEIVKNRKAVKFGSQTIMSQSSTTDYITISSQNGNTQDVDIYRINQATNALEINPDVLANGNHSNGVISVIRDHIDIDKMVNHSARLLTNGNIQNLPQLPSPDAAPTVNHAPSQSYQKTKIMNGHMAPGQSKPYIDALAQFKFIFLNDPASLAKELIADPYCDLGLLIAVIQHAIVSSVGTETDTLLEKQYDRKIERTNRNKKRIKNAALLTNGVLNRIPIPYAKLLIPAVGMVAQVLKTDTTPSARAKDDLLEIFSILTISRMIEVKQGNDTENKAELDHVLEYISQTFPDIVNTLSKHSTGSTEVGTNVLNNLRTLFNITSKKPDASSPTTPKQRR
jgi:hypothetical protein